MKTLSVIIPVYNEEKYLQKFVKEQIQQLKTLGVSFEIIISENGSTDKTLQVAQSIATHRPYIKVLTLNRPNNYGQAVKNGFLEARGKFLVLHDLDYWDIPFLKQALPMMVEMDGIVAAKRGKGSQDTRSLPRKIITGTFSTILKLLFGMKISDTHGIKILNRKSFLPLVKKTVSTKEIFDSELLIRGEYEGLKIGEIGITVREKRKSRSSIIKRAFKTIRDLVYLKIKLTREYSSNPSKAKDFIKENWLLITLLLVSLLLLLPSLRVPFSLIDDGVILERSHWISDSLKNLRLNNLNWLLLETDTGRSRPFYWISLYIRYLLVGTSAISFHLINILMVLSVITLVFLIAKKLSQSQVVALFTSLPTLIFYRTMENYYRLGTQEPLMLLLLLLAIYLTLRETQTKWSRLISNISIVCAVLTKETAIFIIPILLLITIFSNHKRRWIELLCTSSITGLVIIATRVFKPQINDYSSNYQFSLSTLVTSIKQYKLYFDSAYITPLVIFAFISFVIGLLIKDSGLTLSIWGLIWIFFSLGMLIPWKMAFGRYLLPVLPGLGLFIASEGRRQLSFMKRIPIVAILLPVLFYYWANFIFVNTVQSINVIDSHLAREVAAAQMVQDVAKYSPQNAEVYFNFPYDENNLEWIDGTQRHLKYIYNRPDLSAKLIGNKLPQKGIIIDWSFVPTHYTQKELSSNRYNIVDRIQIDTPQFNPLLKDNVRNWIKQDSKPLFTENFTWDIYSQTKI